MKTTLTAMAFLATMSLSAMADDMHMMPDTTLGDLTLTDGFAHATLPNQPVAGGFVTITNTGDSDDTLIAAQADIANVMQIHTMAMDGGVMVMRELPDGITIPAGDTVTLAPGGNHLMFMQLNGPLDAGDMVPVTLTFTTAGDVTVPLPVRAKTAAGMMSHGDDHK